LKEYKKISSIKSNQNLNFTNNMGFLFFLYLPIIFGCCLNKEKRALYTRLTTEFSNKLDIKTYLTSISFINKIIKILFKSKQIDVIKEMLNDDLSKLRNEIIFQIK
jgi:hypothetical protein